jgi:hypothetical protein
MAAGSYAHNLTGDCLEKPLSRENAVQNCIPFREFCVHTVLSGPYGAGTSPKDSGVMSCGRRHPAAGLGTGDLPVFSLPSGAAPYGKVYGRTSSPVSLSSLYGDVYFNTNDLQAWRLRNVYPERFWYAQGPPVEYAHLVTEVRRRLKRQASPNNSDYQNRLQFYWTDALVPHDGNGKDWLGALHPAGYMWTNKGVPEPFKAVTHFEQSGIIPQYRPQSQGYIPFCDPMPVRSADGTVLGSYTGYCVMHYASSAFIHMPIRVQDPCMPQRTFLPDDYYEPIRADGTYPKINPINQLIQVESVWFLVGQAASGKPTLGSPRIGGVRHWFYNRPYKANGDPCDEYFYIQLGSFTNDWIFNVNFNVIESVGGSYQQRPAESIKFNLSGLQVYLTP